MTLWHYILIALSFLLLVFMCWQEWQRTDRSRLLFRLLASIVAVACFACFALPLTKKVTAVSTGGKQAILLTEGFDKDSVSSFLHHANEPLPVYVIDRNIAANAKNYSTRYVSPADWLSIQQQMSAVHVFGYGFDKDELQTLPGSSLVFHPSSLMNGITSVNWQQKIKAGDQLLVQGSFYNSSSSEVKLILAGYDADLDTAVIPANSHSNFALTDIPRQLGKAVYALRAVSGSGTLEKEPVPFEVEQPGQLKILVLSSSPDFETKFLKSWLSQNSYAVVTRTATSKNKYEKTFFNTPQISFGSISASFLHGFDVLIADQSELAAMGSAELAAVESQVAQRGMGLIVKVDSAAAKNSFYSRPFPVMQDSGSNQKTISLIIPSTRSATALATEHPAFIRKRPGTQSLIEDNKMNVMVSSSLYGAGKLIYSTLDNTFTWMLSGDNKNYQAFWSYLLEKAAVKTGMDRSWTISTAFPTANKAVDIHYASNSTETPRVQVGENFVHLTQNPGLPFQWQGSYWPERAGWQPLMQENQTYWWYAYSVQDYKMIAASAKLALTRRYLSARAEETKEVQQLPATVPVSKKYFLIIFLFCAGFLWLEKKL